MPVFDKNAAFIWAIIALGLAVPLVLGVYATARENFARQRVERLKREEGE